MLLIDLYNERIKDKLSFIEKELEKGVSEAQIARELKVNEYYWNRCKQTFPDLVTTIEKVKGERSEYYTKIVPNLSKIGDWIALGASDRNMAKNLDVSPSRFTLYRKIYPEFNDFLINCREEANGEVESALFRSAIGFSYEEKKESIEEGEYIFDANGDQIYHTNPDGSFRMKDGKKIPKRKPGKVRLEKITKEKAPNINASTLWLTNRKKNDWSIRNTSEHFFNPSDAAKAIQDNLKEMEGTIPSAPELSDFDKISMCLTNLSTDELEYFLGTINSLVESKKDAMQSDK